MRRLEPLSGAAFVVLFSIGSALWAFPQPAIGAAPGEIVDFYEGTSTRILVGGSLSLVSMVFLAWFGSVLHSALAQAESEAGTSLPQTAFAGVLLLCAVGLGAETINMVGAVRANADGGLSPEAAQIYLEVSSALGYWAAGAAMAIFAGSTALVALRTGAILPRWLAWASLVLAAALLTPILTTSAGKFAFVLPLILIAVLSARIHRTR